MTKSEIVGMIIEYSEKFIELKLLLDSLVMDINKSNDKEINDYVLKELENNRYNELIAMTLRAMENKINFLQYDNDMLRSKVYKWRL
jgi:hypothetical protein